MTEILTTLAIVAACSAAYCFIVGELTMNNSQMDKLWSILPAVYVWIVAIKGGMTPRLVIMAVLATVWGARQLPGTLLAKVPAAGSSGPEKKTRPRYFPIPVKYS